MASTETSAAKYTFDGGNNPLQSRACVAAALEDTHHVDPRYLIVSQVRERHGGVVIDKRTHDIVGAWRSPMHNPISIDEDGNVEFGGGVDLNHLEGSMERTLGMDRVQADAWDITEKITDDGISVTAENFSGFSGIGNEPESFVHDESGRPTPLDPKLQEELLDSMWETSTLPSVSPQAQAIRLAKDALRKAKFAEENSQLVVNTSVPLAGSVSDLHLNDSADRRLRKMVCAVQTGIFENLFDPQDATSRAFWDRVAVDQGYKDFNDMKTSVGDLSLWAFGASHGSLGLFHRFVDGSYYTSVEEAVALSDLLNSDFATVAEWMTYSSPLFLGNRPMVQTPDGRVLAPKDARAVLRLGSLTANPAPFIGDAEAMKEKVHKAMYLGHADRLDRASYIAEVQTDEGVIKAAACHARVRNRMTQGDGLEPYRHTVGRVEFVGGGGTPDITANIHRNSFLQLLSIYSERALAEGTYPTHRALIDGGDFSFMRSADNHISLAHAYNFDGADSPHAQELLAQAYDFLKYMQDRYPSEDMQYLVDSARLGLDKLWQTAEAETLEEYADNPVGSISDVILKEYEAGVPPEEIVRHVHHFQKRQAERLLEVDGDVLALYKK